MSFNSVHQMQVTITLPRDEKGMMGRECPKCELVFNIKTGTGLKGEDLPCHCAYCGHAAARVQFFTKAQIQSAKSLAMRQFTDQLHRQLTRLEFNRAGRGPFGIGISMRLTTRPYSSGSTGVPTLRRPHFRKLKRSPIRRLIAGSFTDPVSLRSSPRS